MCTCTLRRRSQKDKAERGGGGNGMHDDFVLSIYLLQNLHLRPQEKEPKDIAEHEGGGDDLDDDFAAGSSSESGEDDGSGSEEEDSDAEAGPLQRRQKARAAGDEELQARLRWVEQAWCGTVLSTSWMTTFRST